MNKRNIWEQKDSPRADGTPKVRELLSLRRNQEEKMEHFIGLMISWDRATDSWWPSPGLVGPFD